jgi:hypothetical protein
LLRNSSHALFDPTLKTSELRDLARAETDDNLGGAGTLSHSLVSSRL